MRTLARLLIFANVTLALAVARAAAQTIQINEIRIDQPSADNDEYFELSSVPAKTDLAGLTYLVLGDGPFGSGAIEAAIDLGSLTTDSDGFLLVTDATFSLGAADLETFLNFENGDNVTHMLVSGFSGALGDDLDVDDDGTLDVEPWMDVLDAVSLVAQPEPDTSGGQEHYYGGALGFTDVISDTGEPPAHVMRCPTSPSDWRVGSFDSVGALDTPGGANSPCDGGPVDPFCEPPSPNSVSSTGGMMSLQGTASISANDAVLVASPVPNFSGVFVQSDIDRPPFTSPFGGTFCVGGQIRRIATVGASGNQAAYPIDFTDPATLPAETTMVGSTIYYQFFHRDTIHPGGGNITAGIRVTWAP